MIKLPRSLRPIGVVTVELFNCQIPLFHSDEIRRKAVAHLGINEEGAIRPCLGCVSIQEDNDGGTFISMTITPDAGVDTWAHEAVHLADLLMDDRGVPTDVENTEVRAYMVGNIVLQIQSIMAAYARYLEKQSLKS